MGEKERNYSKDLINCSNHIPGGLSIPFMDDDITIQRLDNSDIMPTKITYHKFTSIKGRRSPVIITGTEIISEFVSNKDMIICVNPILYMTNQTYDNISAELDNQSLSKYQFYNSYGNYIFLVVKNKGLRSLNDLSEEYEILLETGDYVKISYTELGV